MLRKNPLFARLAPKLAYQLAPAAIVSTIGIVLLSNLAKAPETTPIASPAGTAIQAEAVFRIVPRQRPDAAPDKTDEGPHRAKAAQASPASAAKPRTAATSSPAQQQRKAAAIEPASVPPGTSSAPLTLQPDAPKVAAAPSAPADDNFIVAGWRRMTDAMGRIPQWARSASERFSNDTPPRPPAPVPEQNFIKVSL